MQFQIPGTATTFADLPVGSFFMFDISKRKLGICVSDGQKKAAIMLPTLELAIGGLPSGPVVSFPSAVLRASHTDICDAASGSLISAAGALYIRASQIVGGFRTFNLATGQMEALPQDVMAIAYSRWAVGIVIDGEFGPIFSFPSAAPSTPKLTG